MRRTWSEPFRKQHCDSDFASDARSDCREREILNARKQPSHLGHGNWQRAGGNGKFCTLNNTCIQICESRCRQGFLDMEGTSGKVYAFDVESSACSQCQEHPREIVRNCSRGSLCGSQRNSLVPRNQRMEVCLARPEFLYSSTNCPFEAQSLRTMNPAVRSSGVGGQMMVSGHDRVRLLAMAG